MAATRYVTKFFGAHSFVYPWSAIPPDAIAWFRDVFADVNRHVSETLVNVPAIRETSLDDVVVTELTRHTAPTRLPSHTVVRMDIHNIGGLRQFHQWEIADIGILVFVIHRGQIVGRKIALLQAKRLYPKNLDVDVDDLVNFRYGMNRFLRIEESPTSMLVTRKFDFDEDCIYGALKADSDQQKAIQEFEKGFGRSVFYLLYNPPLLPVSVSYPLAQYQVLDRPPDLGARVIPADDMHKCLASLNKNASPTFLQACQVGPEPGGWRLEIWAAELILTCQQGRIYSSPDEISVRNLLERRTGPIAAVIALSIELSPDVDVGE